MRTLIPILLYLLFFVHTLLAQKSVLEEHIAELITYHRIPGLSLAYFEGDGPPEFISKGLCNADSHELVDDNTVFSAASLSKPVTAYITLKLVEIGKIDLDTPLANYFQYADLVDKEGYLDVTPKMVLTHMTGLPNWRNNNSLDFIQEPGTKFGYSGEGFVWLQKTIEVITGKQFDLLAAELVLTPLQMSRSSLVWEDRFKDNYATPHDELMFPSAKWKPVTPNAAASLQTTVVDYAKFLQELLSPKNISPELMKQMLTPQQTVKAYKGGEEEVMWGLGVGLQQTNQGIEYWHWGNNGNIRSFFVVSPEQSKGLVYLTNSKNGLAMTKEITDLFLGTPQPGYRWNGFKGQGKLYRIKGTFKKKNTRTD